MGLVETITVMFTDLVGSTELSSRVGPAPAEELRSEHYGLLRETLSAHRGHEVKSTGDGLMITFPSAIGAVEAAIEIQQRLELRNRSAEHKMLVRIGIALGDATPAEGDWYGPSVVEGARLCAEAHGGQILATNMVRAMAASRATEEFRGVGELELKGLADPVRAYEIGWEPIPGEAGVARLPPRLRDMPEVSFVGREREREVLIRLWDESSSGGLRVAFVAGEPGIGKTRLATFTALRAHERGAVVLYGRCEEDLGVPYHPWVEALGYLVAEAPEELLRRHVADYGGELARLVPQLARRLPSAPAATRADAETERYLLFGSVRGLLEQVAGETGAVVIVDDLHWADKSTLLLLRHLVADAALPVLVIGAYRDSDITRGHPLAELLADLRREPFVKRIALMGLVEEEVVTLLERVTGHDMDDEGRALAAEVCREAGGNPFFIAEILRNLVESGAVAQNADDRRWALTRPLAELALPQSVREVIGRRIARLGGEAHRVLSAAAVIGREFELDLLGRVLTSHDDALLDLLDQAVEASLLTEPAGRAGRFMFAHALVEHTLYEELGLTRRARMHRRVAEALEELCGAEPGDRLPELAYHWGAALQPIEVTKAVEYAGRAGRRALGQLAPDDALRWFSRALELLDGADEDDPVERCELLLGLGEAQRLAGVPEFRETLLDAGRLSRDRGDIERLTRAVLANTRGFSSSVGEVDVERVELLEAAAALLPEQDPRRANVLSLLAVETTFAGDVTRRIRLAEDAVALARGTDDRERLARVLADSIFARWLPETLAERVELSEELVRLAEDVADPWFRVTAFTRRLHAAFEACDAPTADHWTGRLVAIGDSTPHPPAQWNSLCFAATGPLLHGDLVACEELADRAFAVGMDIGLEDVLLIYGVQLMAVRQWQGRWDEVVDLLADAVEQNPRVMALRSLLAWACCDVGRAEEAAALVESLEPAAMPEDFLRLSALVYLAEPTARLGSPERRAELYELLLPWAELQACTGPTVWGSTHHYLGCLADALGRPDVAERHFASAALVNRRMSAPVFLARTQIAWARLLAERGAGDRAEQLLHEALELANRHGAAGVEREAEAVAGQAS